MRVTIRNYLNPITTIFVLGLTLQARVCVFISFIQKGKSIVYKKWPDMQ